jgi:hypothetical protein
MPKLVLLHQTLPSGGAGYETSRSHQWLSRAPAVSVYARSHKSKKNVPKTTTSMTGQKRPFQHLDLSSDREDDASEPQQPEPRNQFYEQKSAVKEQPALHQKDQFNTFAYIYSQPPGYLSHFYDHPLPYTWGDICMQLIY